MVKNTRKALRVWAHRTPKIALSDMEGYVQAVVEVSPNGLLVKFSPSTALHHGAEFLTIKYSHQDCDHRV